MIFIGLNADNYLPNQYSCLYLSVTSISLCLKQDAWWPAFFKNSAIEKSLELFLRCE